LLALALNLLVISNQPFDDNFNKLNASHLLLFFDDGDENYEEIKSWFEKQNEVVSVSKPVSYISYNGSFLSKGNQIKFSTHLTEYIHQKNQDSIIVLTPEASLTPKYDAIWLPYHFSVNYDLVVGDTLHFQFGSGGHDFVISSFVIDPHFLSGLFNPTRFYMAPGALSIFLPLEKLSNIQVGIRLEHPEDVETVYARFLSQFDFSGSKLDYQLFKSAFSGIFSLFSSVLLILSFLIFVIVLLVLNGTLSSQIYADYKLIGIIKTLGFTPADVKNIYILKLSIISALAIPLGLITASLCLILILDYLNASTGLQFHSSSVLIHLLLSGFVVGFIVLLATLITTYKTGQIKPLQALREGKVQGKSVLRPFSYRRFSPGGILSMQFLLGKPASSLLLCFGFTILTFLILFISGVSSSMTQIKSNKTEWGFLDTDLQISLNQSVFMPLDKEAFLSLFTKFEKYVEKVIPFSYNHLKIISNAGGKAVNGHVYDMPIEQTGFQNLIGNHPVRSNDISICVGTANAIQAQIGDSLTVFIEGSHQRLMVCGIYQDVSAFGEGFRLHASAMEPVNPLFEPDQFGISLAERVDPQEIKNELISFFGEKVTVEESVTQRSAFVSIISNLRIGVVMISFFFILILSILVANDLNIHIHRDRMIIAKLKAIGFTNFQIRGAFFFKNAILLALGLCLGSFFALYLGKDLISILTFGMGLPEFPFAIPFKILIVGHVTILIFGLFSSWNALRLVRGIRPIEIYSD
jgi:putative ABC transport system permease protein